MAVGSLRITVPIASNTPPRVEELDEAAKPSRSYYVSRHEIGRFLLEEPDSEGAVDAKWLDMMASFGLAIRQMGDGGRLMLISRAPQVRDVLCGINQGMGTIDPKVYKPYTLLLPPLLWRLKWNREGRLAQAALFVTERMLRSVRESVQVSSWPYGNAEQRSGRVCWGSTATNHLSIDNPLEVETLFLSGGVNNHLWHAGNFCVRADGVATNELKGWALAQKGKAGEALEVPIKFGSSNPGTTSMERVRQE